MSKEVVEIQEFTWDIVRGLPKANYYYSNNIQCKIACKPGLKDIYSRYSNNIDEVGIFDPINDTSTYLHTAPSFTTQEWLPPNLKELYTTDLFKFDKPVIVIQNKFTLEWGGGPYNYFGIQDLEKILNLFYSDFTVVYFRPNGNESGYYKDENDVLTLYDYSFLSTNYPEVVLFDNLLKQYPEYSYNTLQFMLSAMSDKFITVSGGNACVSSYFGKDVLIFDSPHGAGAGRGIWKTDSWLKLLGNSNIFGFNSKEELIKKSQELWIS